jgi:hypothetical protein
VHQQHSGFVRQKQEPEVRIQESEAHETAAFWFLAVLRPTALPTYFNKPLFISNIPASLAKEQESGARSRS